jgi:hypothetical protein
MPWLPPKPPTGQPVRRAHADRDRRNAQHHQANGENPPRTHLPEDRRHAPGRAHAFVDRADLPDGIEYVISCSRVGAQM